VRFLLSGYYGFGNLGDEALRDVIVRELRSRYPHAAIDVLSAQPDATAHELGVEATPRADLGAVKRAIENADVVLSGGGGLLQNATSLKSLLYYAGIIRSAVRAGKKTMIFAQSVGPLDFLGKQTVRECCKGLGAATVRDERSRRLLASILPDVPVVRTADPVFLYDPPPEPVDLAALGLGPQSDPLVVVAVRKTAHFSDVATLVAAAVDRLAERHGARVAFIPFAGVTDAEAATVVIRKCRSKPALVALDSLDAVAAAIARARVVVGIRLHALILAVRLEVPFLAIPYDPKVTGLTEDIGYPLAPLWDLGARIPVSAAESLADEVWSRRDELARHLAVEAPEQRRLAEQSFTVLERLLHPVEGRLGG
jgi:polysaccharide pyruvyl transferase CsaB